MVILDSLSLIRPEPGLIFWTSIIFILLWILLAKLAFKPIMHALKRREQSIDEALKSAEQARAEMAKLQANNEALLQEAREERSRILREAKEQSEKVVNDAHNKAKADAGRIMDQNRQEIENMKLAAISEMRQVAATLALEVAGKVLRKELATDKAQVDYVKMLVEDIKTN